LCCSGDDPGVGHEKQRQVLGPELSPEAARRLGVAYEAHEAAVSAGSFGFQALRHRKVMVSTVVNPRSAVCMVPTVSATRRG
jgi:hypothetical protein